MSEPTTVEPLEPNDRERNMHGMMYYWDSGENFVRFGKTVGWNIFVTELSLTEAEFDAAIAEINAIRPRAKAWVAANLEKTA